jgi:hypothetical protein
MEAAATASREGYGTNDVVNYIDNFPKKSRIH